jgi:hypothetical protein
MNISYRLSRLELFLTLLVMQFHQPFAIIVYILTVLIFSYVSVNVASSVDASFIAKLFVFIVFESFPVVLIFVLILLSTLVSVFSRKNRPLLDDQSMTFNEDLFIVTSERARSEIQWKALQRVVINFGFVFLYLSQAGAMIIPKRVFVDNKEYMQFVALCRSKLKNNK